MGQQWPFLLPGYQTTPRQLWPELFGLESHVPHPKEKQERDFQTPRRENLRWTEAMEQARMGQRGAVHSSPSQGGPRQRVSSIAGEVRV